MIDSSASQSDILNENFLNLRSEYQLNKNIKKNDHMEDQDKEVKPCRHLDLVCGKKCECNEKKSYEIKCGC